MLLLRLVLDWRAYARREQDRRQPQQRSDNSEPTSAAEAGSEKGFRCTREESPTGCQVTVT
jgi:hypothetical protein